MPEVFVKDYADTDYETVAAGQTEQVLGTVGGVGDLLAGLQIIPLSVSCGAVTLFDGGTSLGTIFEGGATTNLITLAPFPISFGMKSKNGAWKVTTGANVKCIAIGNFTGKPLPA